MAQDWASDVKKYVADADDGVIAGIVRYCGIALQKPDSSLVSFSDPVERDRVRNNFLRKKLALTDADEVLDAAIARVGKIMKGDRTKNRVTVYYLLLEDLGLKHLFAKKPTAAEAKAKAKADAADTGSLAAPLAAAGAVVGTAAATADASEAEAPVAAVPGADPVVAKIPVVAAPAAVTESIVADVAPATAAVALGAIAGGAVAETVAPLAFAATGRMPSVQGPPVTPGRFAGDDSDGKGWWGWLIAALITAAVIALFVWVLPNRREEALTPAAATAPATAAVEPVTNAAAPATAPVPATVPDGAGIVSETREAKPVVKVYFDTAKADVASTFALAVAPLKAWLAGHADSKLAVSGYNDPTGNAAANAALFERAFTGAPLARELADRVKRRLVFGLEELREKLVIWAANLDDAAVECVKLDLIARDPALARARLIVDAIDRDHALMIRVDGAPALRVDGDTMDRFDHDRGLADRFPELFGGRYVALHRLTGARYRWVEPRG